MTGDRELDIPTVCYNEKGSANKSCKLAACWDDVAQLHSERVTDAPRHTTDSVSIPQTRTHHEGQP